MNNDFIYKLLIGKAGVTCDATSLSDLAEGELFVVDNAFASVPPGSTNEDVPSFYIARGNASGSAHKISPLITGKNITKWSGKSYAAATEQVSYIGYNSSSAAHTLTAANSTEYSIHITFLHDKGLWSKRPAHRSYHYTSDASATQAEIAAAFVALMNADEEFARQATAAAVNSGADYGIRITGKALTKNFIDDYMQVSFEIAIDEGFGATVGVDQFGYVEINGARSTTNTNSVKPNPGIGTYGLISDMERLQLGFMGVTNLMKFPVPSYPLHAVSGETYDIYVIEHFDRHVTGDLTAKRDFPMMTILAVPVSNTGMTSYLEGILNPYMTSVGLSNVTL